MRHLIFRAARAHPTAMALLVAALLVSSCSSNNEAPSKPSATDFGHIHGIGLNPADNSVYVASHNGVFAIVDGKGVLIANRRQDTMGFTIAGPNDFLASGHPDPASETPNPLGLIRSTDGARTWQTQSLGGKDDLHSIDSAGGLVYAYGAAGEVMMSRDRTSWKPVLRAALIDFAVDPQRSTRLVATTGDGRVITWDVGEKPRPVTSAPPLVFIDRTSRSELVGVDPSGQVFTSDPDGKTWSTRQQLPGQPESISVRANTWLAATSTGIYQSVDEGRSWSLLLSRRP
ncbi:MAG: exo-alpha-sialidase [Kineosporiaceae bacterium]|nr:exo-alpha-sialidase [Aeromicrobium sp.]